MTNNAVNNSCNVVAMFVYIVLHSVSLCTSYSHEGTNLSQAYALLLNEQHDGLLYRIKENHPAPLRVVPEQFQSSSMQQSSFHEDLESWTSAQTYPSETMIKLYSKQGRFILHTNIFKPRTTTPIINTVESIRIVEGSGNVSSSEIERRRG